MIDITNTKKIYLFSEPIDFRYGILGFSAIITSKFNLKQIEINTLYLFINKKRNQVKVIEFDKSGIWMYTKRLKEGKFAYPETQGIHGITKEEFKIIIEGLDFFKRIEGKELNKIKLY